MKLTESLLKKIIMEEMENYDSTKDIFFDCLHNLACEYENKYLSWEEIEKLTNINADKIKYYCEHNMSDSMSYYVHNDENGIEFYDPYSV